jgi:hypothetical protein
MVAVLVLAPKLVLTNGDFVFVMEGLLEEDGFLVATDGVLDGLEVTGVLDGLEVTGVLDGLDVDGLCEGDVDGKCVGEDVGETKSKA